MQSYEPQHTTALPLSGCRVLERSNTVAAAYAGRMLAVMGAQVVMLEPPGGSRLRRAPPLIGDTDESALFAYLEDACGVGQTGQGRGEFVGDQDGADRAGGDHRGVHQGGGENDGNQHVFNARKAAASAECLK